MAAKQGSKTKQEDATEHKKPGRPPKEESAADNGQEMDEGEELDALMALMEDDELTAAEPETVTDVIDHWQNVLQESEGEGFKEIAENLKQLKKHLTSKKSKTADIAELLVELGEQVDTAANEAKRGYKTKLHTLGKGLRQAGEALQTDEDE
jgi:septation ring formation regulator EzrA